MIQTDLHIHSTYCDGKSTLRESVDSAIEKGFKLIGFSGHSYTFFDESYCMSKENTERYKAEVKWLQKRFIKKISILLGVEQDYYSEEPTAEYDYFIGSVHYLKFGDDYVPVDESAEILKNAAEKYCDGDIYALCEIYYKTVSDLTNKLNARIIGHFDLITKFNEQEKLFDENNPRYVAAWKKCADTLLEKQPLFEINTGAISRGYKSKAYPSEDIINYILQNGGSFILSSDSHSADTIGYKFDEYEKYIDNKMFALKD